jgi:hypothetical protein
MDVRLRTKSGENREAIEERPPAVVSGRRAVGRVLLQDFDQVGFGLRRFRLRSGRARDVLELSGRSFLEGFNAAVTWPVGDRLASAIDRLDPSFRGFAYEGAGMACALLDVLGWSRGRNLRELLAGPASAYPHLVHVGAGWAFAKLRMRPGRGVPLMRDPLLRWLSCDGYGFHQGFFHSDRVVGRQAVERGLTTDQRAIRDQGLGRSLWFHECADPEGIALRIGEFPVQRRGDLWSGVGLAAGYAGGVPSAELHLLAVLAGEYRADLAQGCAFACEARRVSGIVPEHTHNAAAVLVGTSVDVAGAWTSQSLAGLVPPLGTSDRYQQWRAGIRRLWSSHTEGQSR